MNIEVHQTAATCLPIRNWDYAATLDCYDGAPDAGVVGNWIGYGPTAELAEQDLWEQIADWLEEKLNMELCHD
jgi:hypothetical protein